MRLLLVNSWGYLRGGDARCTFEQEATFRSAGHQVERFHMTHPDNRQATYARAFARRIDWQRSLPEGQLGLLAQAASSMWSRDSAQRFDRVVRHFQPQIIHVHHLHRHLTPSILRVAAQRRIPVVWTLHDYELFCPNGLLFTHDGPCDRCRGGSLQAAIWNRCKRGSRRASAAAAVEHALHARLNILRWVDALICPSRFLREQAILWGLERPQEEGGKLHWVPHAAPREWLTPTVAGPAPGEAPFIYVGRLSREKGVDTVLRALEREPRAQLRIFGAGEDEERLRQQAAHSAPGRVRFEGHADTSRLRAALDGGLALVFPSIWYENQPYTLLEAAARGRPVIASDLGGIPETIPGSSGLLFPPGDHEALAAKMTQLLDQPGLADLLGSRARQQVEKERLPELWRERLMGVYGHLGVAA